MLTVLLIVFIQVFIMLMVMRCTMLEFVKKGNLSSEINFRTGNDKKELWYFSQKDMPYTEDGIIPDLIFESSCYPI